MSNRRRAASFAWLLGIIVLMATQAIGQLAWITPYSWAANNVSDLGNVFCQPWGDNHRYVCSPWHVVVNAGAAAHGVALIAGFAVGRALWAGNYLSAIARWGLLFGAAGWIVAALAPADINENVHVVGGAVPIFFLGNFGLALSGCSTGIASWLRATATILGFAGLAAGLLHLTNHDLGIGPGGMERFSVYAVDAWILAASAWVLNRPHPLKQ